MPSRKHLIGQGICVDNAWGEGPGFFLGTGGFPQMALPLLRNENGY